MASRWVTAGDPRRRRRIRAAALLLAVALGACSTGRGPRPVDIGPPAVQPTGGPATPAEDEPAPSQDALVAPLTGLPVEEAVLDRPAVAVALDLAEGAAPPSGLDAADVIFEEVTVPGRARALVLLQSADASLGPVGETRPVDARLLETVHPLFAYSGGPSRFVEQLTDRVVDVSAPRQPGLYSGAPPALTVDTATLRTLTPDGLAAPPPLFAYAENDTAPPSSSVPASRAVVSVPGHVAREWAYDSERNRWQRQDLGAGAPNVLVLTVPYELVTFGSPERTEPSAVPLGDGEALLLSEGRAVTGTWYRRGRSALLNVVDADSRLVRLTPGSTWVVLVPEGAETTVTQATVT